MHTLGTFPRCTNVSYSKESRQAYDILVKLIFKTLFQIIYNDKGKSALKESTRPVNTDQSAQCNSAAHHEETTFVTPTSKPSQVWVIPLFLFLYPPSLLPDLLLKSLPGLLVTLLGLFNFLLTEEEKSLDLLGQSVLLGVALGNALAANEGGDNTGTNNKGQDEAVHAVPVGGKSSAGCTGIVVVQEGKSEELGDKGMLNGEQQCGPSDSRSDDTGSITAEAVSATIASPLETPVNGAEERQNL